MSSTSDGISLTPWGLLTESLFASGIHAAFGGLHYFNYKKVFSLIMLAVVDVDYKFIFVDVRAVGSESEGNIFAQS